jgi:hypothetical protein
LAPNIRRDREPPDRKSCEVGILGPNDRDPKQTGKPALAPGLSHKADRAGLERHRSSAPVARLWNHVVSGTPLRAISPASITCRIWHPFHKLLCVVALHLLTLFALPFRICHCVSSLTEQQSPSCAYRDNDQIYIAGYCICHELVACSTKLR